ncbi:HAAS signaling domain-containing protein [Streptomyces sp. NPDC048473]|uniref:HAAS signaling domain-containing protein n=1 Tax=unclassified Streptomyces TaxID=2593676 RepID=UPI00371184FF
MKTDDTLVRDYLAAVGRESAALPPAARQELIADLGEHIQVALAERPGSIREILHEVGDPRTIATTALQELGHTPGTLAHKPRRRRSPAWLPILLLLVSDVLPYAGGIALWAWLSVIMNITAIVMVCRSRHWTAAQKWIGLTLAALLPVVLHVAWYFVFVVPDDSAATDAWRWTAVALVFVLTVIGCGWLWRTKRP